jgi:1-acyl-sn-glycerol-3-phosphate acyltransferase
MVLHLLSGVTMVATVFPFLTWRLRLALKARWSRQLLEGLGIRLLTAGTPTGGGLLVANHVSWLDIVAIDALAPATFVSKDDVLHWPVVGWLSRRVGTLFIERGSRAAAARTKEQMIDELRRGSRVVVFPEGTTGFGDHVLPFHGALFQSAIDAGSRVAPVLIRYEDAHGRPTREAAYVGETSFQECLRAIVRASGLTVRVTFLPTLDTLATNRRHLAHQAHQAIAHALAAGYSQPCGST